MKNIQRYLLFSLLLICFSALGQKVDIPKKPNDISKQTGYYDFKTNLLSKSESERIERKLINYADTTSTQIVVVVVPTTGGQDVSKFAFDIADSWGIGQEKEDNGILLLVAVEDRKMSIQTGYGTEHLMTDYKSKLIIDNDITPEFKTGNYYAGIDKGTTAIMEVMSGEYRGERKRDRGSSFVAIMFFVLIIILITSLFSKRGGGGRGGRGGGSTLADILILSSLGSSGGFGGGNSSSGGFGGGGFGGGFGGGGFGGGGASGGW